MKMKRLTEVLEVGIPAILVATLAAVAALGGGGASAGDAGVPVADVPVAEAPLALAAQVAPPVTSAIATSRTDATAAFESDASRTYFEGSEIFATPEISPSPPEATVTTVDNAQPLESRDAPSSERIAAYPDVRSSQQNRASQDAEHVNIQQDDQHADEPEYEGHVGESPGDRGEPDEPGDDRED
jgi:hypothetical protein